MTYVITFVALIVVPVVIGMLYAAKRGAHHRPEYDYVA